jgi:hypothetical protein
MRKYAGGWGILAAMTYVFFPSTVLSAVQNSLILNEANTVSGTKYLDPANTPTRMDTALGRVQGNGQNWLEFLAVQGDDLGGGAFKNTLDLRGWKLDWQYNKDNLGVSMGHGELKFTDDPLWAAVPRGTILTISEWQDVWYSKTPDSADKDPNDSTPRNGLPRVGGINGFGTNPGAAYSASADYKLGANLPGAPADPHLLYTDTGWNPAAGGGGANGDWHMHVYAGEKNPDSSFKYFTFSGSVTSGGVTSDVGTPAGGLFVTNNDNWQVTIHDNTSANEGAGNVINGPIGEEIGGFGVNSTEIEHFENGFFAAPNHPTQADYLGVNIADYQDGSSSTFGSPSKWNESSGSPSTQDVSALRSWLQNGDADLDGQVTAADYTIWRDHLGQPGGWRHGDFNGNGIVDPSDYDIWKSNFGLTVAGAGASTGVPEPSTWVLFAVGGFMFVTPHAWRFVRRPA